MQKTHDRLESFYSLDSRKMAKADVFKTDNQGSWNWYNHIGEVISSIKYQYQTQRLILSYDCKGQTLCYAVPISTTACNYGGLRYWFNCPRCYKRVAKLYLKDGMFHCRTCHSLNYATQQDKKLDSTRLVMCRLRNKLGWQYNSIIDLRDETKPKGMHQTTYERLLARHDYLDHKQNMLCMQSFKSFMDRNGYEY